MSHPECSQALLTALAGYGVDTLFGIPGNHTVELYRHLPGSGIRHVTCRHEQGAGFMADGYARATGRPGVAYVITGPGLTNIMTPMGQAYSDSVPVLVISSCLDETAATRGQLHQMKDQRAAADTVCDWSEEARTAQAAYGLIDRAFVEFRSSRRMRPKHIQVPISVLQGMSAPAVARGGAPDPSSGASRSANLQDHPGASTSSEGLAEIASRFARARHPVCILGGGTVGAAGPEGPAMRFLRRSKAAVFVTYAGRGLVSPDYPLNFGAFLGRPDSARLLAEADLVLVVGTELAEVDLWRTEAGHAPGAIMVNTDPEVLAAAHPHDTTLQMDASRFLAALAEALDGAPKSGWTPETVQDHRGRWRAEIDAERPGILPVADALRDCLPEATMIYSDMTQFAYAAMEVWEMDRPGHWHHPTGFGTLGYALPAAIGGAVARPGRPTLAIAGDYGFQYTVQELATAVELRLPLPIFLWDHGKLGEIEDSMVRAQIAPNAVVQRNPDFLKLAEAYGARAAAPANLRDMQAAVRAAFVADGPTLIRVSPAIASA